MDKIIQDQTLTQKNLKQIRLLAVIGAALLACFIFVDLQLLPITLQKVYIQSRFLIQLPICGLFIIITFAPFYPRIHQFSMCFTILCVVYGNYWLILRCWQLEQFSFPYEGTVIYSLFVLFVFRIKFKYALFFVTCTLAGFILLTMSYPIYGERNSISLAFVLCGLVVGLMGVYQIENVFKKLFSLNTQLAHLSQIDQLTNLLNRGTYESRFTQLLELSKRNGASVCVFFIDLDNFKAYNDGYGHLKGDEIIKLQADMLQQIFRRNTDIIARYGGEEYVVVTANLSEEQCIESANEIISSWESKKMPHGKVAQREYVSCSVGFYREEVDQFSSKDKLVAKADEALYLAKAQGRNRFVQAQSNVSLIS
ncbi:GGDEF domain-containing protein [Paraglaciecola sp. L3A3]|uniref:GGDEF domain-containing protein n=1 Tax=Paraglaciecola sp. L3A3 TaxID=2686358 RepID=UPI00131EC7E2|nr:GGDEF domain-containing protein [Paraglaciecola sp. L3A3]